MSFDIQTLEELIVILTLFARSNDIRDIVLTVQSLELGELEVARHLRIRETTSCRTPVIRNLIPLISRKVGGMSIV